MLNIWIFTDHATHTKPAVDLANALAEPYSIVGQGETGQPDILIGVGEHGAPGILAIEERYQGAPFSVCILDPRRGYDVLDLVVIPNYEPHPQGNNIVTTTGLINRIHRELLQEAIVDYEDGRFEAWKRLQLPRPILAMLVGGKHIGGSITPQDAEILAQSAHAWHQLTRGSIVISNNGRTERDTTTELIRHLKDLPYYLYDYRTEANENNPYHAMLAMADAIIVTGDSVRMLSEACSSGKPVYIYDSPSIGFPYKPLHQELLACGAAQMAPDVQSGGAFIPFTPKPLDEAGRIAHMVRDRMAALKAGNL